MKMTTNPPTVSVLPAPSATRPLHHPREAAALLSDQGYSEIDQGNEHYIIMRNEGLDRLAVISAWPRASEAFAQACRSRQGTEPQNPFLPEILETSKLSHSLHITFMKNLRTAMEVARSVNPGVPDDELQAIAYPIRGVDDCISHIWQGDDKHSAVHPSLLKNTPSLCEAMKLVTACASQLVKNTRVAFDQDPASIMHDANGQPVFFAPLIVSEGEVKLKDCQTGIEKACSRAGTPGNVPPTPMAA